MVNILFLSKRRPQSRDLIERPYGRFYHIPKLLSERGHEVHLLLGSHVNEPAQKISDGNFTIYSYQIFPWILEYYRFAKSLVLSIRPDVIVGFSDTWYGIFAVRLAKHAQCACLIDAYDNYESYMPWAKPLHWLWRRSLAKSNLITAAGPRLLTKLTKTCGGEGGSIIPMAADDIFKPMNKPYCRQKLGLPVDTKVIGYCGSAVKSRGIKKFLPVMEGFKTRFPEIVFLFSGRRDSSLSLPANAIHIGYIDDDLMPYLVNAMDATIAINLRSAFGEASYPAKIYESLACGVPVFASRTEATEWILADNQDFLFDIHHPEELVEKLNQIINKPIQRIPKKERWPEISVTFERCLESAVKNYSNKL